MPRTRANSREELERIQLAKLRELLAAVRPDNAFYEAKLGQAGIDDSVASLAEFRANCPFTTKPELAADHAANPPHGSNLTFPPGRYTRVHQTSGTSGAPLRWLDTPESWQWMIDNWCDIFRAAGVSGDDRIFFAFSFGPFIGFWLAFEAGEALGALSIPGGGLSSAARLRAIFTHGANVLCCTPTYALRLAEVAKEEGIDLAKSPVRTIVVAGEPGGSIPATRARLEEAWPRAKVFDHHGMTEVGPVTIDVVLSELGDWRRFRSAKRVVSYAGLDPGWRESAGKVRQLTITKQGSRLMRWALVETAWRLVNKSRRWRYVFEKLKKNTGSVKRAIVGVARRVLCVMFAMLRDGQAYRPAGRAAQNSLWPHQQRHRGMPSLSLGRRSPTRFARTGRASDGRLRRRHPLPETP